MTLDEVANGFERVVRAYNAAQEGKKIGRRVFICSPYGADPVKGAEIATRLCRKALDEGQYPFAPHLLYPRFLDEHSINDRETGIRAGLAYIESCNEIWVYAVDGISAGMQREIEHASQRGIPVRFVTLKEAE